MQLFAEGLNYRQIANQLEKIVGKSYSPATISNWHEKNIPDNWDTFKESYKILKRAKQAEELADQALKTRGKIFSALNLQFMTLMNELLKYGKGETDLQFKSMEGVLRELRETMKLQAEYFTKPEDIIDALLSGNLTPEQQLQLEHYFSKEEETDEAN